MLKTLTLAAVAAAALAVPALAQDADKVKRGEYLAVIGGCNDCHTPLKMTPDGPAPDMTRMLSGHPSEMTLSHPGQLPQPWMAAIAPTGSAFAGPWGISYAANLTPDPETGVLRDFTEEQFVQTMRTGRHQGQGRPILPPMPWQGIGRMTDEDLSSLYAYLRSIPPVKNMVPEPTPPSAQ